MLTSQKSGATQRVSHVGPNTHMAARHMVGRSVTSDSPTGGVQIAQQVTAHGGSQQFISSDTGGHRPNTFKARSKFNMSRTGSARSKGRSEGIRVRPRR